MFRSAITLSWFQIQTKLRVLIFISLVLLQKLENSVSNAQRKLELGKIKGLWPNYTHNSSTEFQTYTTLIMELTRFINWMFTRLLHITIRAKTLQLNQIGTIHTGLYTNNLRYIFSYTRMKLGFSSFVALNIHTCQKLSLCSRHTHYINVIWFLF